MKRANEQIFGWIFLRSVNANAPRNRPIWGCDADFGLVWLNAVTIRRHSDGRPAKLNMILNHENLSEPSVRENAHMKLKPLLDANLIADVEVHYYGNASMVWATVLLPADQKFHKVAINLYWQLMEGTNVVYADHGDRGRFLDLLDYTSVPYVLSGQDWVRLQDYWVNDFEPYAATKPQFDLHE